MNIINVSLVHIFVLYKAIYRSNGNNDNFIEHKLLFNIDSFIFLNYIIMLVNEIRNV